MIITPSAALANATAALWLTQLQAGASASVIEFYTGEKPLLKNVPTWRCGDPGDLAYVLDHLAELVVKEVHGSGGYGMLVGPAATKAEIEDFGRRLCEAYFLDAKNIDAIIDELSHEWALDRMPGIDRNILRMAIHEITLDEQTPTKVAINEAVELAKLFGSESSRRFVNGVLGTLVSQQSQPARSKPRSASRRKAQDDSPSKEST